MEYAGPDRRSLGSYQLTWEDVKKLHIEEHCPNNEIHKIDYEFWNHLMVGAEIEKYTVRFQELAELVPHTVTPEDKCIDCYMWGLAPEI